MLVAGVHHEFKGIKSPAVMSLHLRVNVLRRIFCVCSAALAVSCSVYDASILEADFGASTAEAGFGGGAGAAGAAMSGGGGSASAGSGGAYPLKDASDSAPLDGAMPSDSKDSSPDAGCTPESGAAFCQRVGKNCGAVLGVDNCGNPISVDCGSCPILQACGGGGQVAVCDARINLAKGGTVTSSVSDSNSSEGMSKAFDGNASTKWFSGVTSAWIAYQFAGSASHTVTSYAVTSANDALPRDPRDWQFQGSNDGMTWTTLDTRSSQVFANRYQTNGYTCANTQAYPRYRLNVTANNGAAGLQLAEIQLFGN